MSTTDVTISCPHCRRQYTMKIDPERLQRLKTRATCGRCGKTFDVASRITAASREPATEPKVPRVEVAPLRASELLPTINSGDTSPDLRDEMEELAREFAEAAARFTPVGVKRSALGISLASSEASPPAAATLEEPTNPGVSPAGVAPARTAFAATIVDYAAPPEAAGWLAAILSPDIATTTTAPAVAAPPAIAVATPAPTAPAAPTAPTAPAAPPPVAADVDAAYDQLSLDAEPAAEEEFAAAVPTRSRAAAAPRSWLELADPGLAALQSPPSPGAAALEALLDDAETIALPPSPAAS